MVVELRIKVGKSVVFDFAEDVQEIVIFVGGDLGVKVVEFVGRELVGFCVRSVASGFEGLI